jgi:hypothetical protein
MLGWHARWPGARDAVHAYQIKVGIKPADGFVTPDLVQRLRSEAAFRRSPSRRWSHLSPAQETAYRVSVPERQQRQADVCADLVPRRILTSSSDPVDNDHGPIERAGRR